MDNSQRNIKLCEMCRETASCICFKCFLYFCDSCFKIVHDSQNNKGHRKEEIDYFIPVDTKCPLHPQDRINLYCIDEGGKYIIVFLIK